MEKFTKAQIENMIREVEEWEITIEEVDLINNCMVVKTDRYRSTITFKDFEIDLDIFIHISKPKRIIGKINFKIEDLRQAILNPVCSCGGHIETYYDGEYSEDYTFTCECGAKEVLNGYFLDSLIED